MTRWLWTAAIVADVGIQASKNADDSPERIRWLSKSGLTLLLTQSDLRQVIIEY